MSGARVAVGSSFIRLLRVRLYARVWRYARRWRRVLLPVTGDRRRPFFLDVELQRLEPWTLRWAAASSTNKGARPISATMLLFILPAGRGGEGKGRSSGCAGGGLPPLRRVGVALGIWRWSSMEGFRGGRCYGLLP